MKNKNLCLFTLVAMLLIVSLTSCKKNTLIDETHTFSGDKWQRFTAEHFDVTATSTEECYNFQVTSTIDTSRFHDNGLPIIVEIKSPDNENRTLFSTLVLRNSKGQWMGQFNDNGDLVVSQTVRQFYFFNAKGTYSVNLSQRTSKYEIFGIRDINLKITRVKVDLPE